MNIDDCSNARKVNGKVVDTDDCEKKRIISLKEM